MANDTCIQDALRAAARQDLFVFLQLMFPVLHGNQPLRETGHVRAMCFELMRAYREPGARLAMAIPPRHLKSETVSVAFPIWVLGQDPGKQIMVACYGGDLSDDLARKRRQCIESGEYRWIFPHVTLSATNLTELRTSQGGGVRAITVGGATTGHGADIFIADDVLKANDAQSEAQRQFVLNTYYGTWLSRLNDKRTSAFISAQQRLHPEDLLGHLIRSGRYRTLIMPAIAERDEHFPTGRSASFRRCRGEALNPAREPLDVLDKIRSDMGPVYFAAQYQQEPEAAAGNMLRIENIRTYDFEPSPDDICLKVHSWDTASSPDLSSDYSVGIVFHRLKSGPWLIRDVVRGQWEYADLTDVMKNLAERDRANTILIEKASVGIAALSDLHRYSIRNKASWNVRSFAPRDSKLQRFHTGYHHLYTGDFLMPKEAPWRSGLIRELRTFNGEPNRQDDQVDALIQFINWATHLRNDNRGLKQKADRTFYGRANLGRRDIAMESIGSGSW